MKNTFDKRVRPRVFKEGELVLKKRLPNVMDPRGKWAPNYEAPYVVKQAFSGGAVILADLEGQELTHPVNADAIKMKESKESTSKSLGRRSQCRPMPRKPTRSPSGDPPLYLILNKNNILVTQQTLIHKHAIPKTGKENDKAKPKSKNSVATGKTREA
ncbi:hypothetical protein CR513_11004, partial [Mucuna pruriens]